MLKCSIQYYNILSICSAGCIYKDAEHQIPKTLLRTTTQMSLNSIKIVYERRNWSYFPTFKKDSPKHFHCFSFFFAFTDCFVSPKNSALSSPPQCILNYPHIDWSNAEKLTLLLNCLLISKLLFVRLNAKRAKLPMCRAHIVVLWCSISNGA